jgi:hypothetical protein
MMLIRFKTTTNDKLLRVVFVKILMDALRRTSHISVTCTPPPPAICSEGLVPSLGGQLITNNKRWNNQVCTVIIGSNEGKIAARRTPRRYEVEIYVGVHSELNMRAL